MSPPTDGPGAILVLGGTAEARELAVALIRDDPSRRVVTSLAGRVARPRLPPGDVRVGGFGGVDGLARWIAAHGITHVVDATHPFAETIGANAALAAPRAGVPLLRLARPGWTARPGDVWHRVPTLDHAAALVPQLGACAFVTTGRQGLRAYAADADTFYVVRTVDPPDPADLPRRHTLLLGRGPYTPLGEGGLMDRHAIDVLVTKDSGGPLTVAKLDAARERRIPVIVVDRPPRPAQVPTVTTVSEAVRRLAPQRHRSVADEVGRRDRRPISGSR